MPVRPITTKFKMSRKRLFSGFQDFLFFGRPLNFRKKRKRKRDLIFI